MAHVNQDLWELADEQVDRFVEPLDQAMKSPPFEKIKEVLTELGRLFGERYAVNLLCTVDIFDWETGRTLPVFSHGISTTVDNKLYRTFNDSRPQRYVVDGQIQVVPNDRCPKCWEAWDSKFDQSEKACPHCGTAMGVNCKVLLDSNRCPFCEKGQVSASNPRCDICGGLVEPAHVVWG
jgi:hypothetical protein